MRQRFLFTGALALGFFAAVLMGQSASQPAKTEPPKSASRLAAERLAAAERVCKMLHDQTNGAPTIHEGVEHTYLWSLRRMEAQRNVDAVRGDRLSALEAHAQRMRDFTARVAEMHKAGITTQFELASTQFYVAEAEELLARERAK